MKIKDSTVDVTIDKDAECPFHKDVKCIKTYEEVKKMSLSRCYTCRYNPGKQLTGCGLSCL